MKITHNKINNDFNYFIDELFGGYQYIVNGVELVNTLNFKLVLNVHIIYVIWRFLFYFNINLIYYKRIHTTIK